MRCKSIEIRKKIFIVDSAIDITGAFICIKTQAALVGPEIKTILLLPHKSKIPDSQLSDFSIVYKLPIINIQKKIISLILYLPTLIYSGWKLSRLMKKNNCTILQVNDFYLMHGVIAKLFGYKGKVITWVRINPDRYTGILKKTWLYFSYKFSDNVIAVSNFILEKLPSSNKNKLIYDPVNTGLYKLQKKRKNSTDTIIQRIVYIGNYIQGKGQNHAIEAFRYVADRHKIQLHFYGSTMGLDKNTRFKNQLIKSAKVYKLEDRVFFHDFIDNISEVLNTATMSLNFSYSESFSLTCLEASAHGIPVIATRCGGPEEIILHNKTGLLVNIGDINQMSSAINELLDDPEKACEMGQQGREYVLRKFSIDKFKKNLQQVFERE